MRQLSLISVTMIAAALLAAPLAAEEKLQKLSGSQIRVKLAGFEFTDEIHFRESDERSGRVTSSSMGRKRTGKWRVEKDQF
jgi:hypothetical protein